MPNESVQRRADRLLDQVEAPTDREDRKRAVGAQTVLVMAVVALVFALSLGVPADAVRAQELGPSVGAVITPREPGAFVFGTNWNLDGSVTVEVFDGPDAATATSLGTWIGYPGGLETQWWFIVDLDFALQPGWLVQVTGADSGLTAATVVTNLTVTGWEPASGVVSGTTSDPSPVGVDLWSPAAARRNAEMWADATGLWHWSADFSRAANAAEGEWGDPVVLDLATTRGQATQELDPSGATLIHFGSPELSPSVGAVITPGEPGDSVVGADWNLDGSVTVEVFDGPDAATATSLGTWIGYPGGLETEWWFGVDLLDFSLQPGWLVQVTGADSGLTAATVVTNLTVTGWDPASGVVSGTTSDPSLVVVDLWSPAATWRNAEMWADATGLWHWSADFSRAANAAEGEWGDPVVLGLATTRGQAIQNPDPLGGTLVRFGSQADGGGGEPPQAATEEESNVIVFVSAGILDLPEQFASGQGWTEGDEIDLYINGIGPLARAVAELNAEGSASPSFDLDALGVRVEPGDEVKLVRASDQMTRVHVVTSLTLTSVNLEADTVSGTAAPGSEVFVGVGPDGATALRNATTDAAGVWQADFSQAGDEPGEEGTFDITADTFGIAQQLDEDGNATALFWFPTAAPTATATPTATPTPTVQGEGEQISDDRGRSIDSAVSLLDDIVLELYPDDQDKQELIADGTIGDLFRDLRGKGQVKEVTEAIRALVKGPALVDRTVDLESDDDVTVEVDKATGEERRVMVVSSASKEVTVRVPVQAIEQSGQFVAVTVEPIADLAAFSASVPLPSTSQDTSEDSGTPIVTAMYVELSDENGEPLTEFDEDLTITLQVDPATTNLDSVVVVSFDDKVASWAPIAATVSSNGVVEFSVDHLTLFALLRLVQVTHTLTAGLNSVTFTGPSGTLPALVAAQIGGSLENLLTFDVTTQSFRSYVPGASPTFNTLETLSQREAVFVRVTGGPVTWTVTDIIPSATGSRAVAVMQGLNAVGFTGGDGTDIAEITSVDAGIESISRFDTATQQWLTYVPGAPLFANTLTSIGRLDVFFVRYSGPAGFIELPEVGGR